MRKAIKDVIRQTPVLMFAGSLCACTSLQAPTPSDLANNGYTAITQHMGQYIPQQMKAHKITGLSVALVDDQHVIWSQGFGFADKENVIAATPSTRYRAGSISKPFTAMAIMQLQEQGRLDINKPLQQYVPEFSIKRRGTSQAPVTLKNILTHHSGLPDGIADGMWSKNPALFTSVASRLDHYYLASAPNTVFAYSNLAFSLAGMAIETASQQSYQEYMREHLLEPLAMKNSDFSNRIDGPNFSKAYANGKVFNELGLRDIPAGGLNTTVMDLSKLIMVINNNGRGLNGQLLKPATLQTMFSPHNKGIALDLGQEIGLGWFLSNHELGEQYPVVEHSGQTISHNAILSIGRDLKLGVVIMANSGDSNAVREIAQKILRLAYTVKTGEQYKSTVKPHPKRPTFNTVAGDYSSTFGFVNITGKAPDYSLRLNDNKLKFSQQENGTFQLKYRALGLFPVDLGKLGKIAFYPQVIDGHQLLIGNHEGFEFIAATKIKPGQRNATWDRRLGRYQLTNQFKMPEMHIASMELSFINGYYLATTTMANGSKSYHPLKAINGEEAITYGIGRGLGETLLGRKLDGETIIEYSGLVFKKDDE